MLDSIGQFFTQNMVWVFVVYGASFLIFAAAAVHQGRKVSSPALASAFWMFAAFGLLHGLTEWTDVARLLKLEPRDFFDVLKLVLASASFVFLLQAGIDLFTATRNKNHLLLRRLPLILAAVYALWLLLFKPSLGDAEIVSRYCLGFPGALVAGLGFLLNIRQLIGINVFERRDDIWQAGLALCAYAFFAGLVVSPADWLGTVHVPVQVFRTLAAAWAAYAMLRAHWTLFSKLLTALVPLAILPPLIIGSFSYANETDALTKSASANLANRAYDVADEIKDYVEVAVKELHMMAEFPAIKDANSSREDRTIVLKAFHNTSGLFEDVSVFAPNGDVTATSTDYKDNRADRDWFKAALDGKDFVSDVSARSSTGTRILHVAVPVFRDGKPVGVIRGYYFFSLVERTVQQAKIGKTGFGALLDKSGKVISHENKAMLDKDWSKLSAFQGAMQENNAGGVENLGNTETVLGYAKSEDENGLRPDWVVLIGQPTQEALDPLNNLRNIGVAVTMLFCVIALAATYYIVRTFARPIDHMVNTMRKVESGDYSARSTVAGTDEIAQLSTSLNVMLDATVDLIQTKDERDALQNEIKKLLTEVSNVADGDLTVEAEVTPDVLGSVADSFNFMIDELRKIVGNVQTTTLQVTGESNQILESTENLARGAELQAVQISDTSAAVEEMTVSIQQVSENAEVSAVVAQDALHNARQGEDAVDKTVEAMNRIRANVQETAKKIKRLGESSQEIGEIVRFIDDIADQTNLLALNAAIQAAMAGEHGRGFAVVADEVRRLAERSANATKQISTLVKSIQAETNEVVVAMEESTREVVLGSKLADEAGKALGSIDEVVNKMAKLIESISLSSAQQARAAENVAKAMNQISQVTFQTTDSTKYASERANRMVGLAEQLKSSVAAFRLPS